MRLNLIGFMAMAGALALGGCASLSAGLSAAGVTPATQATVHLDTAKALNMAYDALDFVAVGLVEPQVLNGTIKGQSAVKIAGALKQARGVLDTAYNAYHAGIASNPSDAITSAYQLVDQVKAVLSGVGVVTSSGPSPAAWRVPNSNPKATTGHDLARVLAELRSA